MLDGLTLLAAVVLAVAGVLGGLLGPAVIRRIPEPSEAPRSTEAAESAEAAGPVPATVAAVPVKERYRDIATLPGLGPGLAAVGGVLGAAVGLRIGWHGVLLAWAFLVPVGVLLSVLDWRTRLLPTRVVAPSYPVVVALTGLAALIERDAGMLASAALGWAVMGGCYLLLWLVYPAGMGYGDVRLSGVLGIGLGALGIGEVVAGVWLGFLLGGLGGLLLTRLGGARADQVRRRAYPQGPFMVAGAVAGVLAGSALVGALGY